MIGREQLLGYQVVTSGAEEAAEEMARWVQEGDACKTFACLNPHTYVGAQAGSRVSEALASADWLVPDGVGVVLASRILGGDIRRRITGHDVFSGVLERLNRRGTFRVFFFGSTPTTLAAIKERMASDYPNLVVAGTLPDPAPGLHACRPPFPAMYTPEQTAAILGAIRESRADVLWVGMTAPKQETWIHEHRHLLPVRFAGAVGAVFDFYIGRIRRSPPIFQDNGLEWLPRLVQEPRRLWRRMFISAPVFMWHVARARLGRPPASPGGRAP